MRRLIAKTAMQTGRNILMVFLLFCGLHAQDRSGGNGFTAHEWGTFTSVAGSDGRAVEWRPLDLNNLSFDDSGGKRSKELPSFVETLHWTAFKGGLFATIRMETPVLYFYSSHPVTVSVRVNFAKGLITEWYPHSSTPALSDDLNAAGRMASLYAKGAAGGKISWNSVALEPGVAPDLPHDADDNDNRYYAARETLATPLRVNGRNGVQHEKFLFYRGVSLSSVPVTATFTPEAKLRVRNLFKEEIPTVILFERRGDQVGYRISGRLRDEVVLGPPQMTSTVERLYGDLEEALVARGLFPEEAHAMVQTWRDSWFEEGSRLFYIVPSSFVDAILPLSITPAPDHVVRVFVGRLELISPATQEAVSTAMAAKDKATLAKYGRFLQQIQAVIREKKTRPQLAIKVTGCFASVN